MLKLTFTRLAGALPNVIGVVIVTFLLTRALPGDPAAYFAGPAATQEAIEQIRAHLGLDKSLAHQFALYLERSRPRRSRRVALHRPAGRSARSPRGCPLHWS